MELNTEQIIQAMKCCYTDEDNCLNCPYMNDYDSCVGLSKNALALIEQLTEENERLKSVEFTCGFIKPHKVLECPIFDEIVKAKADTVREMQERIKTRCIKSGIYPAIVARAIDQIAKEMLEGDR